MLSQLLQSDPNDTTQGINQAQAPEDSFDSLGQPSVTPAQYVGPRLGPFIETLKPGFEFGMDTLGARKGPQAPPFPRDQSGELMKGGDFTEAMGWESAMKAKPWAENLQKNPAAVDQLAKNLQEKGVAKNDIEQWGNFMKRCFGSIPIMSNFFGEVRD